MEINKNRESMLADIDLVILDMDGTLYTLDGDKNGFTNSTLHKTVIANSIDFIRQKEGCSHEAAQELLNIALGNDVGISKALSERYGITREDYFKETWNINPEGIVREYEIPANVIKKLEVPRVLLTSAPKTWQEHVFQFLGFSDEHFASVYTGEMFGTKIEIFEQLAATNKPEKILSVGDQAHTDIEPAELFGMKTLLVNSPKDLAQLLK